MGPILALVAPTGMGEDERTTWLRSAYAALDGMPIDLIRRGVASAIKIVDHPAKIIPAVMREAGDAWENRRRLARNPGRPLPLPAPTETDAEREERLEVAKLARDLVRQMEARISE